MLKVLIVEDELLIADLVQMSLVEAGYEVCGIARTVSEAVALAQRYKPELAVIDVRLADGDLGTEIPAKLDARGRPGILYATGNIAAVLSTAAEGHACLTKPYRIPDLLRSLEIVAEFVATGTASPPFPRGFRLLAATCTPRSFIWMTPRKSERSFANRRRSPISAVMLFDRAI